MAATEKPRENDEAKSKKSNDVTEEARPISRNLSSTNLLSVSPPIPHTTLFRLVVVSSKIRQPATLESAALKGVSILIYEHDEENLDTLLARIKTASSPKKPVSIAFLAHGHPGSMILCSGRGEEVLSIPSLTENEVLKNFFEEIETCIDRTNPSARLDLLSCPVTLSLDWPEVIELLKPLVKELIVGMTKDIMGPEISGQKCTMEDEKSCEPGDLYFQSEKLRKWSGATPRSISLFEKIKVVGKGSYGAAVLYRKKDDESLVILKEINMHDLTAQERLLATNEATIMSKLNHPNIINCYDSFEEDGTIWIEMEYADGGTLAQYLTKLDHEMEEQDILKMFYEMVLALQCIHQHKILHRDIKTQNIFLTLDGEVKLGDFGISKQLGNTKSNANTVLGTPYYISPEICEGKDYNEKSDIWSLGCVLYEMANKQKTFESTNLPALVNKIVKGQFAPIRGNYSMEFKGLVRDCLQIEPQYRPNASDLVNRVQKLLCHMDKVLCDKESLENALNPKRKEKRRSILYYVDLGTMSGVIPIDLPVKIQIKDVSVGKNHVCVVSAESLVFSWGDNSKGQLGHGDLVSRDEPTQIEGVKGKNVVTACCGDRFTVLLTDNGIVMSFGDGDYGCMGHGDWSSVSRPKLVEGLLAVDTGSLSCGPRHVCAVCDDGSVYTWGCGGDGRLGLGDDENRKTPHKVEFSDKVVIKKAKCGNDGTMFLTETGTLFACGKNTNNKLGLNNRQGFLVQMKNLLTKFQVEGRNTPTPIKVLAKNRVSDMCLGPVHSSVLMDSGQVYTFGDNRFGQLGHGSTKSLESPTSVRSLVDKHITMIKCGECFTVAGTDEDTIYFWGSMPFAHTRGLECEENGSKPEESYERRHKRTASSSLSSAASDGLTSSPRPCSGRFESRVRPSSGTDHDQATLSRKKETLSESANGHLAVDSKPSSASSDRPRSGYWRSDTGKNYLKECASRSTFYRFKIDGCLRIQDNDPISEPTLLFQWDAINGPNEKDGDYPVFLKCISGYAANMFIQIDTTAPAPRKKSKRKSMKRDEALVRLRENGRPTSAEHVKMVEAKRSLDDSGTSSRRRTDSSTAAEQSSSSEMDTIGDTPTWLKDELKGGINLDKEPSKFSEDESAGAMTDQESDEEVFIKPGKDVPRIKKPVATPDKTTYTKYRAKAKGAVATETKIVGGVAMATATGDVRANSSNGSYEPAMDPNMAVLPGQVPTDVGQQPRQPRRKRTKVKLNSQVFYQPGARTNGATNNLRIPHHTDKPRTPSVTSESGVEMTPLEQLGVEENQPKPSNGLVKNSPNKRGRLSPNPLRKARVTPNGLKAWEKPTQPVNDARLRPSTRPTTNVTVPAKRRVCSRDEEKGKIQGLLIPSQPQRKDSREKRDVSPAKHQVVKFPKPSDVYVNGATPGNDGYNEQLNDSRLREQGLVDEIQVLKSELLKQSSQLQENFHIVISLQEQVARLQEEQLKQQAKEKRQILNNQKSDLNSSIRRASMKSAVCSIM